jgi:hypothetical protein
MTALWVILAIAAACFALSWLTAAPAARGVPVSVRLAEARRIVAATPDRHGPPPHRPARPAGDRSGPRSQVARCATRVPY